MMNILLAFLILQCATAYSFPEESQLVRDSIIGAVTPGKPDRVSVGPNLVWSWFRILPDACLIGSHWEDSGWADPGEDISIRLSVYNVGDQPATGISATLSSLDDTVTVIQGQSAYPDILPGQGVYSSQPFELRLSENIVCPNHPHLNLTLSTEQGIFTAEPHLWISYTGNLYMKNFDVWPPFQWAAVDNGGCASWEMGTWQGVGGSCAEASTLGCQGSSTAELRMPQLDLQQFTGPYLYFNSYFQDPGDAATATLEVTLDDGLTWKPMWEALDHGEGTEKWIYLDIRDYRNDRPIFRFMLRATTEGSTWQIDNLGIQHIVFPAFREKSSDLFSSPCGSCLASQGCNEPGSITIPTPQDGEVLNELEIQLSWDAVDLATYYEVWMAKSGSSMERIGSTASPYLYINSLTPGTTYGWKVTAYNSCGLKVGKEWTFSTATSDGTHHVPPVSSP